MDRTTALVFDGHIMGASFASGDRIVAGRWFASPFGPFADVMWARPDGTRVLLAPREEVRAFVDHHYSFEEVWAVDVRVERVAPAAVAVEAGPIRMTLTLEPRDAASWLLGLRPRVIRTSTAWIAVEDALLRPVVGTVFAAAAVHTRGTTRAGTRECYGIHDLRWAQAVATVDGVGLGAEAPCPPAGFGFSEFPSRPAVVRVTSRFAT